MENRKEPNLVDKARSLGTAVTIIYTSSKVYNNKYNPFCVQ
jgi:hypothetical protein